MYNAEPYKPPSLPNSISNEKLLKRAEYVNYEIQKATEKGVQTWQVNMSLDKEGITLSKYFKLNFAENNQFMLTQSEIRKFQREYAKKARKHEKALIKAENKRIFKKNNNKKIIINKNKSIKN